MKEFEYKGDWFLPGRDDRKIKGVLKYSMSKGILLELEGTFKTLQEIVAKAGVPVINGETSESLLPSSEKADSLSLYPIILGLTKDGTLVTLYQCREIKLTISKNKLVSFTPLDILDSANSCFSAEVAIIGCHFEKKDDIVFDSMSFEYPDVIKWLQVRPFSVKREPDKERQEITKVYVTYHEDIHVETDDCKISFEHKIQDNSDKVSYYNLESKTAIRITPNQSTHIEEFISYYEKNIESFLTLAFGKPVQSSVVEGRNESEKRETSTGKPVYNDALIVINHRNISEASAPFDYSKVLFTYSDIKDNINEYLNNWFKKSKELKPVYDLYFAIPYNPRMYIEHKFLTLVQALEGYHRIVYGGKYVDDKEFEEIKVALVEAIPENLERDFKDSLKDKIKYLHEFSLQRRLKEIMRQHEKIVNPLIGMKIKDFAQRVKEIRNRLTHPDNAGEREFRDPKKLYFLIEKLTVILKTCLLHEMGFPAEKIEELWSRNMRYKDMVSRQ